MHFFHGWRYYRNLALLLGLVVLLFIGVEIAWREPIHFLWVVPLLLLVRMAWISFHFAHPPRRRYFLPAFPEYASLQYEKVTFPSRDGLTLFGWYLAGRKRAAILLLHGLGNAGIGMTFHAAPLIRAGYSVFMIDLRAHASSDGDISTYGVREAQDVAGAVDYLLSRGDIGADKIGVLGISLGAQAALRGALVNDSVRALVLEGLGPATLNDHGGKPKTLQRWINHPINWLSYAIADFMCGVHPTDIRAEIGKLAPRPLLLIACGKTEIHFNRKFYAAASEPKALWELPKARHAMAFFQDHKVYMAKVIGFFDNTFGFTNGTPFNPPEVQYEARA